MVPFVKNLCIIRLRLKGRMMQRFLKEVGHPGVAGSTILSCSMTKKRSHRSDAMTSPFRAANFKPVLVRLIQPVLVNEWGYPAIGIKVILEIIII